MADVRDLFYHGVREQLKRVLTAIGPDRLDNALTAFETGDNNWSNCFFARAYPEVNLNRVPEGAEKWLAKELGFNGITPIRIVWHTFDELNHYMTPEQMREFVAAVRDDMRPAEVRALLQSLDLESMSQRPVEVTC